MLQKPPDSRTSSFSPPFWSRTLSPDRDETPGEGAVQGGPVLPVDGMVPTSFGLPPRRAQCTELFVGMTNRSRSRLPPPDGHLQSLDSPEARARIPSIPIEPEDAWRHDDYQRRNRSATGARAPPSKLQEGARPWVGGSLAQRIGSGSSTCYPASNARFRPPRSEGVSGSVGSGRVVGSCFYGVVLRLEWQRPAHNAGRRTGP